MILPFCPPNRCMIEVISAQAILPLDVAVHRPKGVAYLAGYIGKVGVRRVGKKVVSRWFASSSERLVVLAGVGRTTRDGDLVWFIAPRAHEHARHVVTAHALTSPMDTPHEACEHPVAFELSPEVLARVRQIAGWSVHAGFELDEASCARVLQDVKGAWRRGEEGAAGGSPPSRLNLTFGARRLPPPPRRERSGVVLFGFGHYARTCLMPTLTRHYELLRIHEIDPMLIGQPHPADMLRWSTSPEPEPGDEQAAMWCVAGYHHHHAALAMAALEADVDVLVEKPLVTSSTQLDALLEVWQQSKARLWQGFHRRTWQARDWMVQDLGITPGQSVVHHHSVVHEVSLPEHHWYRWPSGGSRLVMNGCHWLDEFMSLNGHREPVSLSAQSFLAGEVICVQIELEHGATCSLTLSSAGSDRLGVRESTHVSCGERGVRLTDTRYVSEHGRGVIRRERIDESQTYVRMVEAISQAQKEDRSEGDSIVQTARFWRMIFELEAMLST